MKSGETQNIQEKISKGMFSTALVKDTNAKPFPSKDFSGLCFIREKSNPINVEYRLKISSGTPLQLFIGMTSISQSVTKNDLNNLWNFIYGIEIKKRQR